MTADDVSLAVLGSGPWAQRHMQTIDASPGLRLCGVLSRSLAAGGRTLEGVTQPPEIWADWDAMRRAGMHPDGIILACEPDRMEAISRRAVDDGVAILAEKPLTLSETTAAASVRAAAGRDVLVMVNFVHLYSAGYRAFRDALAGIEPLERIVSVGGNRGPDRVYMPALWDYGAHDVAFALDIAGGEPREITAKRVEGDDRNHVIAAELRFAGGLVAELTFGNRMREKQRQLTCLGGGGRLTLSDHPAPSLRHDGDDLPISGPLPLTAALTAFAAGIRAGATGHPSAPLAVQVNRILQEISELTASGVHKVD